MQEKPEIHILKNYGLSNRLLNICLGNDVFTIDELKSKMACPRDYDGMGGLSGCGSVALSQFEKCLIEYNKANPPKVESNEILEREKKMILLAMNDMFKQERGVLLRELNEMRTYMIETHRAIIAVQGILKTKDILSMIEKKVPGFTNIISGVVDKIK